MKKIYFLLPLIFLGCTFTNTTQKVKEFTKCFIHQIPAPFWVCYQSSFLSVGKIHTNKFSRLKQEEAYSVGVSELIAKLQTKTKLFLRKLNIKNDKLIKEIKNFVILNALQGDTWFNEKEKMIYTQVKLDKVEFKNYLFEKLKKIDKKILKSTFDETF